VLLNLDHTVRLGDRAVVADCTSSMRKICTDVEHIKARDAEELS